MRVLLYMLFTGYAPEILILSLLVLKFFSTIDWLSIYEFYLAVLRPKTLQIKNDNAQFIQ